MPIKPPDNLIQKHHFKNDLIRFLRSFDANHFIQLVYLLLIVSGSCLTLSSHALERFETLFLDTLIRLKPPAEASHDIIYIEVAEDTLQAIKERPFPRHYHGVMVEILKKWGAKTILFDYLFEGKTDDFNDKVFEEALKKNTGGIYLPVFVESIGNSQTLVRSISEFQNYAEGTGHINLETDNDGILRRFKPFVEFKGFFYPHIGLKIAYDHLSTKISHPRDLDFKTDKNGSVLIDWAGNWADSFRHYSYVDILTSFEQIQNGAIPTVNPKEIKNKICLIGHTAAGGTDIKATPVDRAYPGVGIIANILNAALNGKLSRAAPQKQNMLLLIALSAISILFLVPFRNRLSFLAIFTILILWFIFVYFQFHILGIWNYVFHPAATVIILFVFSTLFSKTINDKERLQLYKLSTIDGLTKVAVRRFFDVRSKHAFEQAKRFNKNLSIILLDIDNFKKINDSYGHQTGDAVLRQIAEIIHSVVRFQKDYRDGDVVARYGGEEFALLLPGTDLKAAAFTVAERIRHAIEENPIRANGVPLTVTISLGVSSYHNSDKSIDTLIKRADDALYRSKAEGRNRTSIERFD